jgi:hypothetical protein
VTQPSANNHPNIATAIAVRKQTMERRGFKVAGAARKLVAQRILNPGGAVDQLSKFPDEPLLQMKWVKQMLVQTEQAANNVLDHHAMGTPGTLDWRAESQHAAYDPEAHLSIMQGLAGNYRPVA